jgi:spore germination protein KB
MLNHTITAKQAQCLISMFWLGTMILLGYNKTLKQDSWAGILLAAILFLPLLFLYARIIRLFPCQDFFSIMIKVFGNVLGKIFSAAMVFYSIHLGSLVLKHSTQFITDLNLTATPQALIFLFLSLIALWSLVHGPENLGRLSKFAYVVLIGAVIVTTLMGCKDMNFDNLKPVLNTNYKVLLGQSVILLTVPFGESVICLPFFAAVSSLVNPLKVFLKALAVTTGLMILANLRNVLILGTETADMYYYPAYQAISIVSLGDFFTRMEILIGLSLVLAGFFKFATCVYTASLGLRKIINFPTPQSAIVQSILVIFTLATMVYSNTIEMLDFFPYYPYYAMSFQLILPLAILITAEIKMRKKKPEIAQSITN